MIVTRKMVLEVSMIDFILLRKLINKRPSARFKLDKARAKAYSKTQQMTGMPRGSASGDTMLNAVDSLMVKEARYKDLCSRIKAMQDELEPFIDRLPRYLDRTVMHERYIKEQSVISIANKMIFERDYIYKILRRSEEEIQKEYTQYTREHDIV